MTLFELVILSILATLTALTFWDLHKTYVKLKQVNTTEYKIAVGSFIFVMLLEVSLIVGFVTKQRTTQMNYFKPKQETHYADRPSYNAVILHGN